MADLPICRFRGVSETSIPMTPKIGRSVTIFFFPGKRIHVVLLLSEGTFHFNRHSHHHRNRPASGPTLSDEKLLLQQWLELWAALWLQQVLYCDRCRRLLLVFGPGVVLVICSFFFFRANTSHIRTFLCKYRH